LDYRLLRSIHSKLKQLTDLRERVAQGPRKIKMVSNNEANFLAELESAKQQVTKTRLAIDAQQMTLNEREAKVRDMNRRLNEAESNKEYQLLKDRIAADVQANSVLQDEILEMLERLDGLVAVANSAKANHAKSQLDTKKITDQVALELEALQAEIKRVSAELAEAEKQLPSELITDYRRLVAGMGENAFGSTDTETCDNCCQRLTTQMAADLTLRNLVRCQGCGCMLYIAESHPLGRT
jgi:predicted  nucleic acid-binding Zn-ribbon protein